MAWYTYPRNETLVHQQLYLHQLHHCHPSQRLPKQSFRLRDITCTRSIYTTYKIIACIERALTALRANIMRVTREYKAGEGVLSYSQLTNWCLTPPLRVKLFKKPQNSELKGFLLQVNLQHKIQVLWLITYLNMSQLVIYKTVMLQRVWTALYDMVGQNLYATLSSLFLHWESESNLY